MLKQRGASEARGPILAFTDSDVTPDPGWLQAIVERVESGAEAVVGPSMFRNGGLGPYSIPMVATASISWGFVLGPAGADGVERPNSLLAHNIAVRREVLERRANFTGEHQYSFGSSSFYRRLLEAGVRVEYEPRMRAAHAMTFAWWLKTRHFRGGWETYKRWEMCDTRERSWAKAPALVEPLLVFAGRLRWQLALWWRYSRAVGYSRGKAVLAFPVAVVAIVTGLCAEVLGMYAYLAAPQRTAHLAGF